MGGNGVCVGSGVRVGSSVEPGWVGVKVWGTVDEIEVDVRSEGGAFSASANERLPTTSTTENNP